MSNFPEGKRSTSDKLVGVKFPGRETFDIHIRFDLTVVLLTLTMFMVKPDHIVIRLTEVCPPGIYLDIGRKQILAMLINGASPLTVV